MVRCEISVSMYSRRSEEHTSELQSHVNLVCRLLLEKKKTVRAVEFLPPSPPTGDGSSKSVRPTGTRPSGWHFFFNDTATTEIYTLSLHDALPISSMYSR